MRLCPHTWKAVLGKGLRRTVTERTPLNTLSRNGAQRNLESLRSPNFRQNSNLCIFPVRRRTTAITRLVKGLNVPKCPKTLGVLVPLNPVSDSFTL